MMMRACMHAGAWVWLYGSNVTQVELDHDTQHLVIDPYEEEHYKIYGQYDAHVRRYDVVLYHVKALSDWLYMYWTLVMQYDGGTLGRPPTSEEDRWSNG